MTDMGGLADMGILVICDEAHVGIPEDGTYVKDLDPCNTRVGGAARKIQEGATRSRILAS